MVDTVHATDLDKAALIPHRCRGYHCPIYTTTRRWRRAKTLLLYSSTPTTPNLMSSRHLRRNHQSSSTQTLHKMRRAKVAFCQRRCRLQASQNANSFMQTRCQMERVAHQPLLHHTFPHRQTFFLPMLHHTDLRCDRHRLRKSGHTSHTAKEPPK